MTRGRAPNLALPLTRALTQQRDYRARKAAKLQELEEENDGLRHEIDVLRETIRDLQRRGQERGERDLEKELENVKMTLAGATRTVNQLINPGLKDEMSLEGPSSRWEENVSSLRTEPYTADGVEFRTRIRAGLENGTTNNNIGTSSELKRKRSSSAMEEQFLSPRFPSDTVHADNQAPISDPTHNFEIYPDHRSRRPFVVSTQPQQWDQQGQQGTAYFSTESPQIEVDGGARHHSLPPGALRIPMPGKSHMQQQHQPQPQLQQHQYQHQHQPPRPIVLPFPVPDGPPSLSSASCSPSLGATGNSVGRYETNKSIDRFDPNHHHFNRSQPLSDMMGQAQHTMGNNAIKGDDTAAVPPVSVSKNSSQSLAPLALGISSLEHVAESSSCPPIFHPLTSSQSASNDSPVSSTSLFSSFSLSNPNASTSTNQTRQPSNSTLVDRPIPECVIQSSEKNVCCQGLFDCSALPPPVAQTLDGMATRYLREFAEGKLMSDEGNPPTGTSTAASQAGGPSVKLDRASSDSGTPSNVIDIEKGDAHLTRSSLWAIKTHSTSPSISNSRPPISPPASAAPTSSSRQQSFLSIGQEPTQEEAELLLALPTQMHSGCAGFNDSENLKTLAVGQLDTDKDCCWGVMDCNAGNTPA